MKNILLITSFLFLSACAKNGGNGPTNTDIATVPAPQVENTIQPQGPGVYPQQPYPNQQQYPYSYHYTDIRCSTGPQYYQTIYQYCEGLKNERRNNYCAVEARYNDFRHFCLNHNRGWQRR